MAEGARNGFQTGSGSAEEAVMGQRLYFRSGYGRYARIVYHISK